MGPAATIDLMQKILAATPAQKDQDHTPIIVWSVPQIPDRSGAMLHGDASPLPALLQGAKQLQRSGATALAIACNTAHHWADEITRDLDIPLLHIADAAVADLRGRPIAAKKVALLATRATLQSGFYQRRFKAHDIEPLIPCELDQAAIGSAIRAVKGGDIDLARQFFVPVANRILAHDADTLLLGCTELPLLLPGTGFEAQCLDATAALARACVRHAFPQQKTDQQTWRSNGLRIS
jgi:aspartate racemase